MIADINLNPDKSVVFIGHSAGADSIILTLPKITSNTVIAVVLLDPYLQSSGINLALPTGDNVKVYDTAFDGVNILPPNEQLDEDIRSRWPNEENLHQALAKDEDVKEDAIAFIEERLH